MAFWHLSQADIWTHNEALSGTSPTWARTVLLPSRRAHCRSPALQLTSAYSTSSVEIPQHETRALQTIKHSYLIVCWPWTSQVWIRFCDSINNKLIFHSCQTKEPERLKLTLILAHICRMHLSFQLSSLACVQISFYRRHYRGVYEESTQLLLHFSPQSTTQSWLRSHHPWGLILHSISRVMVVQWKSMKLHSQKIGETETGPHSPNRLQFTGGRSNSCTCICQSGFIFVN